MSLIWNEVSFYPWFHSLDWSIDAPTFICFGSFPDDFESRFSFSKDLPSPEPYVETTRTYPSKNPKKGGM